MSNYETMRKEHQDKFDSLPIYFSFSAEQFREIVTGLGLNPDAPDICERFYSLPGGV